MAQKSWIYADSAGMEYSIGLYHGSESGHVMVYCNDKIMVVDFSIVDTKKYSFYVGEEFFELDLNKIKGSYEYELRINEEISTPLNIERKAQQKNYVMISVGLGILILSVIFLTSYLLI